jgi:hypothetical protein
MNLWIKVFRTNDILLHMIEYLPSNDILKLCSLNLCKIEEIYKIYHRLYLQLRSHLNISLRNIGLLSDLTRKIIEDDYKIIENGNLKYLNNKPMTFSPEENCIRKIIFEKITKIATTHQIEENIMSLYYLFHNYGFYSILSRFISDEIVISPFESAFSKVRHYENEQTLRMALRFKHHNMIKQLLADMKFIAIKNNLKHPFWFINNMNNILFESVSSCDLEGFKIMIDFIHLNTPPNFSKFIIFKSSDTASQLYSNEWLNNRVFHSDPNLIVHTLKSETRSLFKLWNWGIYKPPDLNIYDFLIYIKLSSPPVNKKFIIKYSTTFLYYINYQYEHIIKHIEQNETKFVNLLFDYLNVLQNNVEQFQFLVLTLLSNNHKYLFMIIYIIIQKIDNLNLKYHIYEQAQLPPNTVGGHILANLNEKFTIVEFLENLIYLNKNIFLNNIYDFAQFMNFIFIHKLFCD